MLYLSILKSLAHFGDTVASKGPLRALEDPGSCHRPLLFDMVAPLQEVLPQGGLGVLGQRRHLVLVDVLQHPLVGAHDPELAAVDDQVGTYGSRNKS